MKFLIVDDDNVSRTLACILLKKLLADCDIQIASNGMEALITLQNPLNKIPDIVLLDLDMPIMGGLEFLKKFQQLPLANRRSRVIVVSGSVSASLCADAKVLGAVACLEKPLQQTTLEKILTNLNTTIL